MDTREQKNMTRALEALSPYLNSPRQTVIRIEAFVALVAVLLFAQLMLGPCRWRSGHWFIQGGLWLCYTLSFPLITYTIGLMASSPIKNGLYPLWAVLLFWASGCTYSITVYALEDNKQWKRYLFELFQYYVYSVVIFRLMNPSSSFSLKIVPSNQLDPIAIPLTALVVVLFFTNIFRVIAGWMVTNSSPSRVVADYMQATDLRGDEGILKGCRYLVRFYGIPGIGKGPTYRSRLKTHQMVTVNTICQLEQFGDDENGGGLAWKDVCLSLALSELLKRRFYGMECAEANLPETREFILKGLLKQDEAKKSYTRAFQIIEVELGFLYDFFFTKYAILAEFWMIIVPFMAALKLILISICGALVVRGSITIKTSKPVIEVGTTSVDVTITIVIIGALSLVEVVQVIFYVASDWVTVSLACSYTRRETNCWKLVLFVISCLRRFNLSRTKFGKFLHRLNLFGYWQNKIGQSSVIEGCLHARHSMRYLMSRAKYHAFFCFTSILVDLCLSMRYSRKTFLVVPDLVKSEIVSVLEEHCRKPGPLTNGKAALDRDANFREFAGTLSNGNGRQTMIMLIWHIATEYCRIASSSEADESDPHRDVAITLSKYCAYLMSFVPDLLPGDCTDTLFLNHAVLLEANKLLRGKEPVTKEILLEAIQTKPTGENNEDNVKLGSTMRNNNEDTSIFIKGLRLGTELEDKGAGRWKVLAEFWAETIIFIAPSDNAVAHMERLAQGGEFLTHIWALLNHAGILTREQELPPQDDMVQP